jgi:hypothetical protein
VRLVEGRGERSLDQQPGPVAGGDGDRHERVRVVPGRRVLRVRPQRVQAAAMPGVVRRERARHRRDQLELRRLRVEAILDAGEPDLAVVEAAVEDVEPRVQRAEAPVEGLGGEPAPAPDHAAAPS